MDKIILYLIGICLILGGIDYILGNPLKIGQKFEEGIKIMGAIGLSMIGIFSVAPVLAKTLFAVTIPICKMFYLDPSILPASFLAIDMGGYKIAVQIALSHEIGLFSGIIIASSLGATISFTIPIAISMLHHEDEAYFYQGVMVGIASIPVGFLAAGIWQKIDLNILLWNLMPIFIFAVILVVGLIYCSKVLLIFFKIFGRIIIGISIIGLLLVSIKSLYGIEIIFGLVPLEETMVIVGKVAFVLGGAYPMMAIISRIFNRPFKNMGKKMGINLAAVEGILGNLASNLVLFGLYKDMNPKGKVICAALAVSGSFVLGGQFGFVVGVAPEMIGGFIISKITAGIISVFMAIKIYDLREKIEKSRVSTTPSP